MNIYQVKYFYSTLDNSEQAMKTVIAGAESEEHLAQMFRMYQIESNVIARPLEIRKLFSDGFIADTDVLVFRDNHRDIL